MERCIFCGGDVERGVCRACGRLQLAAPASAPTVAASGPLSWRCPDCGAPAQPEARFCKGCGYPLRALCPTCKQEVSIWATLCPACAQPLRAQPSDRKESGGIRIPFVQTGESLARLSNLPSAQAAAQTGTPGIPSAPGGPQTGAPRVPSAPGSPSAGLHTAPVRGVSQAARHGLRAKLLGTATGKTITVILAVVVVVAAGTTAVIATRGSKPPATAQTAATPTPPAPKTPTPPPLPGPALRKMSCSRKVDKCGTVFER